MSSPGTSPAPSSPPAGNATATPPPPAPATSTPPPAASASPPPAPVVTPPPASSPPPPAAPAPASSPPPAPPATSPPSPPSSTPTSPPPSTTPSPPSTTPSTPSPPSNTPSTPSPPSTTPSTPSGSSPSPPSGGNQPPSSGRSPPGPRGGNSPPSSSNPSPSSPSSGGGGVSTPVVVGIAVAAVALLAILSLIFIFCRKKKRRSQAPYDYYGPPPTGPKVDPYGGPAYQWQHNAPPPEDHVVSMPPKLNPTPGGASRPPHSPLRPPPSQPPPPPAYISSSGGSGSNYSGSEAPLPPPSPGVAYGFSNSTFSYEELSMATDGFSDANLLGQGGFGYVHRGILPKDGKEVAIKQLKAGSGQGEREFQAEVEIISRVHHKHLVSLVGYCMTGEKRLLVYEFVPNNTLEFHLHGNGRPPLDWPTRLKIALGSAKGLAYLHEDCHPKIIHRDIKAANILLNFNFEAKVADFGLAKFTSDVNTHVSTRVMGTFGYLAPEYAASGKLTDKSDVFSFGVVLLELITGRRPVDPTAMDDSLVDWARPLLTRALDEENFVDLVDPRLHHEYNSREMARVVACAAACVRHSARRRPRMSQVVRALEGDVSLADLNEGIRPGHSTVYSSHGSSDYDTAQYKKDMSNFRKAVMGSTEYGTNEYSGVQTSEYGLNPSGSSSEAQTTREMEMGKVTVEDSVVTIRHKDSNHLPSVV